MYLKPAISLKLKKLRNDLGYSTEYVSQQLNNSGFNISPNTLYNYENGVSQPKADMFISLCKIYNVEDFNIFFDAESSNEKKSINHTEQKLLNAYREHTEMQPAINKMLDIDCDNSVEQDIISEIKHNAKNFTINTK